MALVWLRAHPTHEVLGFFRLNRGNAQRGVMDVRATLEAHTVFVRERPAQERQKLRSVQAVMDVFPDVRLVIDAEEQRVRRCRSGTPTPHSRLCSGACWLRCRHWSSCPRLSIASPHSHRCFDGRALQAVEASYKLFCHTQTESR